MGEPGSEPRAHGSGLPGGEERIPLPQAVLDNPFILLFIGVAVPAVFYLLWGVMDIVQIPIAR